MRASGVTLPSVPLRVIISCAPASIRITPYPISNERNNVGCVAISITGVEAEALSLFIEPIKGKPGEFVIAVGRNFPPLAPLIISIGDIGVSKAVTDKNGVFKTEVIVPDLPEGRVSVTAALGDVSIKSASPFVVLAKSAALARPTEPVKATDITLQAAKLTAAPGAYVYARSS